MLVLLVLDTRVGVKWTCFWESHALFISLASVLTPSGLKTVPTSFARIVGTIWMCLSRPFWKRKILIQQKKTSQTGFPKTAAVPRGVKRQTSFPGVSDLGQLVGCDDSYDQLFFFFWRSWWVWITGTPLWQGGFNESSVNNLIVNTCPKIWRPLEMGIA